MTKNSSINLSVVNNLDGFTLSGTSPSGRSLSITSGSVTFQGGGVINNGQLLIGNSSTNSYDQGNLYGINGISIISGSGNLGISIPASGLSQPKVQNISYLTGFTPNANSYDVININGITGNMFFYTPTGASFDAQTLLIRFSGDTTTKYMIWDTGYSFGTDITTGTVPVSGKFRMLFEKVNSEFKWEAAALRRGF